MDKPKGKIIASVNTGDVRSTIYVMQRVEQAAGELRTRLLISDDKEPNAFSFVYHGNPMIAINIGMINLIGQDRDAMAALVGHELAHLYLQHVDRRISRDNNGMVASALLSFTLGFAGIPVPISATDVAATSVSRAFSRDDEREADQFGVKFMANAGFDPWGAMRLQGKLLKVASSSMLPFLNTHPSSAERVENMRRLAMETSPDQALSPTPVGRLEKIETITLPTMQE